jgi:hypothetical protein
MVATIAAVAGTHALYWFSGGPDFGPRYWYLMVVPCIALAARGALALGGPRTPKPGDRSRALAVVGTLVVGGLIVFVPWRAADKYHGYRGMRPDLRQLADSADFGRSLVLINGRRAPDLASAAVFNPLDLDADVPIYAWDRERGIRLFSLDLAQHGTADTTGTGQCLKRPAAFEAELPQPATEMAVDGVGGLGRSGG